MYSLDIFPSKLSLGIKGFQFNTWKLQSLGVSEKYFLYLYTIMSGDLAFLHLYRQLLRAQKSKQNIHHTSRRSFNFFHTSHTWTFNTCMSVWMRAKKCVITKKGIQSRHFYISFDFFYVLEGKLLCFNLWMCSYQFSWTLPKFLPKKLLKNSSDIHENFTGFFL